MQTVLGCVAAHYGFGKMHKDIKPTYPDAMMYFFIYQICYKMLGGFTKLTFCFLYLRIFNQRWFHKLVIAVATIVALGSLAFTLGTVFQCTPIHRAWDRTISGHCTSNTAFWFSHAAFNSFFDIVVYLMPIPLIRTLKLAKGQKTGLISIFSLGAFVIAASIVRMVMLRGSAETTDPTWGSMEALIWTEIEANTSVVCCCLPALRVPFINLWRWIRGRGRRRDDILPHIMRAQHDSTWDGPHQPTTEVGPTRPAATYQPKSASQSRSGGSRFTTGSKTVDSWYERVLQSLSREKETVIAHSPSQENVVEAENGTASKMDIGAIYKRTDVHVSTTNVQEKSSEPSSEEAMSVERDSEETKGKDRQMSLYDFLNEKT